MPALLSVSYNGLLQMMFAANSNGCPLKAVRAPHGAQSSSNQMAQSEQHLQKGRRVFNRTRLSSARLRCARSPLCKTFRKKVGPLSSDEGHLLNSSLYSFWLVEPEFALMGIMGWCRLQQTGQVLVKSLDLHSWRTELQTWNRKGYEIGSLLLGK